MSAEPVSSRRAPARAPAPVPVRSVPRWASPVSLVLALAGVGISGYLTVQHYSTSIVLACPDTGLVNCTKVTTSAESVLAGVPVALLGLLWFCALVPLMLPVAWRAARLTVPRLVVVGIGLPMVVYLVYTEAITLRALCLYCTAVHVLTVLLFAAVALASALVDEEPVPVSG